MKLTHTEIKRNKLIVTFDDNFVINMISWKDFLCALMLCVTKDNQGNYTGINYDDRRIILNMLSTHQTQFSRLPTFITNKLYTPSYLILTGSNGEQDLIVQSLRSFSDDTDSITPQGAFLLGGGFLSPLLLVAFGGKPTIQLQPNMACIYSNPREFGRLYIMAGNMVNELPLDSFLNDTLSLDDKKQVSNLIGTIPRGDKLRWIRSKDINNNVIKTIIDHLVETKSILLGANPKATLLFNLINKLDYTLNSSDQALIDWVFNITEKATLHNTRTYLDTDVLKRVVPDKHSIAYFMNEMKNSIPVQELNNIKLMYEKMIFSDNPVDIHNLMISNGDEYFHCVLPQAEFLNFLSCFSKKQTTDEKKQVTYSYELATTPLTTLNPSQYFLPFQFYNIILPFIHHYYGADGFSLALMTMTDAIINQLKQQNIPEEEKSWSFAQLKAKYAIDITQYCRQYPENCLSDRAFFTTLEQYQPAVEQKWIEYEQFLIEQDRLQNKTSEPIVKKEMVQKEQLALISSNPKLNGYYNNFNSFISTRVLATKVIHSGYIDINKSDAGKTVDTAASLAGALPMVGGVAGVVGASAATIFNTIDARNRQNYLNQTGIFTSENQAVTFASALALHLIHETALVLIHLSEQDLTDLIEKQWSIILEILNKNPTEMTQLALDCNDHVLKDLSDAVISEIGELIHSTVHQTEVQYQNLKQFINQSIDNAIFSLIQSKNSANNQESMGDEKVMTLSNISQENGDDIKEKIHALYSYLCNIKDKPRIQKGTLDYYLIEQLLKAASTDHLLYCSQKKGLALFNQDPVNNHFTTLKEKLNIVLNNITVLNELQNPFNTEYNDSMTYFKK